jgi:hypothetical protein
MPSPLHEAIVLLFRERPQLAPDLLRAALAAELPAFDEIRLESNELGDVVPPEYRADVVIVLSFGGSRAVLALAIEAQLGLDARKRFTWPVYATSLRARHGCDAAVVVVAPDEAVARWCEVPIPIGPAGCVIRPIVIGPARVPIVTDEAVARAEPELAVLSAIAHGRGAPDLALAIAKVTLAAAADLDEEHGRLYADLVLSRLGAAARAALEELMIGGYEYQSDFAKKWIEEGLAKGRAQGRVEGRAEGLMEGQAKAVLTLLAARGIAVSDEVREQVSVCRDPATLDGWLVRAATATRIEDVLG